MDNEFFVPHGYLSDEEAGEDEQAALWNRNLKFLPCGIGTGTGTCEKVGTGTMINYGTVGNRNEKW